MSATFMKVWRLSHGFANYCMLQRLLLPTAALLSLLYRTSLFHLNHVIHFLSAHKSDVNFYLVTPTIIVL